MKKTITILLIIAIISGGYWFFFGKNSHVSSSKSNNSNTDKKNSGVVDSLRKAENAVTDFVSEKSKEVGNIPGEALSAVTEKTTSVTSSIKNAVSDGFGKITESAFTAAVNKSGEILGVGTTTVQYGSGVAPISAIPGKAGDMVSSPLGTVIKRGQVLTFVISNDFFKSSNITEAFYDIAWGDGSTEHQKIYIEEKNKFVTHTFQKVGEYEPFFTFDTGKSKTQYKILVIVEE